MQKPATAQGRNRPRPGQVRRSFAIIEGARKRVRAWFGEGVTPEEIDLVIEEAKTHRAAKDFAGMEAAAQLVVNLARSHLENGHPFLGNSASFLAEAVNELDRTAEAEQIRFDQTTASRES